MIILLLELIAIVVLRLWYRTKVSLSIAMNYINLTDGKALYLFEVYVSDVIRKDVEPYRFIRIVHVETNGTKEPSRTFK